MPFLLRRAARPTLATWLFFGVMGATVAAVLTCTLVIDGFVRIEAREAATRSLQTHADALRDALDHTMSQHDAEGRVLTSLPQFNWNGFADAQGEPRTEALVLGADGTVLFGPTALQGKKPPALVGVLVVESKPRGSGNDPGPGWTLVLRQPEPMAMAQFRAFHQRILQASGVLCLLLAPLLWLLAGRLAAPMRELTARLDTDGVAGSPNNNPLYREAELLGEALDRHEQRQADDAAHLRELNATLEARVAERTAALAGSEQRLRTITDNLPVLISYINRHGRYEFCNGTYKTWLGVEPQALVGRTVEETLGPEIYPQRKPLLARALSGERVEFEMTNSPMGVKRHTHTTYLPDVAADGSVAGLYALVIDVTAMKAAEEQLMRMARTDPLTGLPNRLCFDERLNDALARSRRSGMPLALLFLDVDKFKLINDTLGHAAGDEVLRLFGQRLLGSVRETDTVARLAGDEFVVILEELHTLAEPQFIARKIIAAVNRSFELHEGLWDVSTSIGIAFHAEGLVQATALLAAADRALYEAKAAGRNTYRLAAM